MSSFSLFNTDRLLHLRAFEVLYDDIVLYRHDDYISKTGNAHFLTKIHLILTFKMKQPKCISLLSGGI